jgi:coenzyme F420 hydrogenase subunit beta
LLKSVIHKGLCTGCGSCVGICPNGMWEIIWMDGDAEPSLGKSAESKACGVCSAACPGKDVPMLELEEMYLEKKRNPSIDEVGVYRRAFKAHAKQEAYSRSGSRRRSCNSFAHVCVGKRSN